MNDKIPFIVHCGECKHEWPAFYSPMILDEVAEIASSLRCPMCAEDSMGIFASPAPVDANNTSSKRV